MSEVLAHIASAICEFMPIDGMRDTVVPGVYVIRLSHVQQPANRHWPASLGFIVQGMKELVLEGEVYRMEPGHCAATLVDLPLVSRMAEASPERPFLALQVELDPVILNEVESQLEPQPSSDTEAPSRAVFAGTATERMLDTAERLARLISHPEEAVVVGPLVIRELYYLLLKGPNGDAVRLFVRSGSKTHQIARAVSRIRMGLADDLDAAGLAAEARMSRSAFFKYFKEITAMSPIQYQKQLRLLEARRLMVEDGQTAEGAAYRVGYRSPSQFSREYARMFGGAPLRDARRRQKVQPVW